MSEFNPVLQAFAQQVADEFPELKIILDQAAQGELDVADAMRCLAEIIQTDSEISTRFEQVAFEALAPLRGQESQPDGHDGLIMHRSKGLPRLNPLVEAALIERAQFDDDIPELRTGGLPKGVSPAVSVDTRSRNAVAVGLMLQKASDQVAQSVQKAQAAEQKLISALVEHDDNTQLLALMRESGSLILAEKEARELTLVGKNPAVDAPEYRRGQVPAPVKVEQPSGSFLLALSPDEKRSLAWKFLSTTQGRRTALGAITELVAVKLQGEGFDVLVNHDLDRWGLVAHHDWSMAIDGPGSTQATFNLVDTAAIAIAKGLTKKAGDYRGQVLLEVQAINTVDIRTVGWAGRILRPHHTLLDQP